MKKKYSKPEILFENFSLSVNIAGNCGHDTSLQNEAMSCGLEYGGDVIFLVDMNGCKDQFDTDDGSSGICYHNPTDTTRLFNS